MTTLRLVAKKRYHEATGQCWVDLYERSHQNHALELQGGLLDGSVEGRVRKEGAPFVNITSKLDGVGPVDNRPTTDKLTDPV